MTSDAENSRAASGSLEADRLAAAVNAVADRYDPDQIILFGSAARGEMTEGSDIDLLVINDHNHPEAMRRERMRLNGDRIDVVQMRREDVERHRRTAATIQEAALSQGITVLLKRNGHQSVATGQSWFTDESGMVKSTKLKPNESARFLRRAVKKWNGSNLTENDDETRCYLRHQAVEQCLKGLITAQGRSFKHVHELNELWTAAESEGEPVQAPRDDAVMKRLAEYAGDGRYAEEDPDADRQMLADSQELGDKVVSYSREAIPRLTRDTNTALAKTPKLRKPTGAMAVGRQSPAVKRPSAIAAPKATDGGTPTPKKTPDGGRADRKGSRNTPGTRS